MTVSGAIGGLLGAVYVQGRAFGRISIDFDANLAFEGILVAIVAKNRPLAVPVVALAYGYLRQGAQFMGLRSDVPTALLIAAWLIGAFWLWLVWDAHWHDQTPRAARNRGIEGWLRWIVGGFYLWLGGQSLLLDTPLSPEWLAWKALCFGLIFVAAIMIDVTFKPVGAQLGAVLEKGSSDETEIPLLRTMNRTRIWVWIVYALLLVTAFLGNVKPLP